MKRALPIVALLAPLGLLVACGGARPQPTAASVGCLERGEAQRIQHREDIPPPAAVDPAPLVDNAELPRPVGRGQEVCVVARLVLDPRGEVADAELLEVDDPLDADAVLGTIRQWRFEPPLREGFPTDASLVLPITVRLPFPAEAEQAAE